LAFHQVGSGRHGSARPEVPFVLVHALIFLKCGLETAGDVPRITHRPPEVVAVPRAVVGLGPKPAEGIAKPLVKDQAGVVLVHGGDGRVSADLREGVGDGVEGGRGGNRPGQMDPEVVQSTQWLAVSTWRGPMRHPEPVLPAAVVTLQTQPHG